MIVSTTRLAASTADELYLTRGMVEGRIIEENGNLIRLETATGVISVPSNIVVRRIRGLSRSQRYRQLREQVPLTPARHVELARWCRETGLVTRGQAHLDEAARAMPGAPEIMKLAGYVQVGDVWIKAGDYVDQPAPDLEASRQAAVNSLIGGWQRRVSTLFEAHFSAATRQRPFETGRQTLLGLRSPIALPVITRILGDGDPQTRLLLVELLDSFEEDEASLQLLVLALLDVDLNVAHAATLALGTRPDPRISDGMRMALRSRSETIVRRAAKVVGWMRDRSAVTDLLAALPTSAFAGDRIGARELFSALTDSLNTPTPLPLDDPPGQRLPAIAFDGFSRTLQTIDAAPNPPGGPYRSEVQDALIELTGQNFGFDLEAWQDWLRRNPPIDKWQSPISNRQVPVPQPREKGARDEKRYSAQRGSASAEQVLRDATVRERSRLRSPTTPAS